MSRESEPGGWWGWFKDLWHTLAPCRWSALSLLLGLIVLFQPQVQDLLRAIADHLPHRSARIAQLLLAVGIWGHTNWYMARVMLYFRFPDTPPSTPRLRFQATWTPRVLGVAPLVLFAIACFVAARPLARVAAAKGDLVAANAAEKLGALGGAGLSLAMAFLLFVTLRRPVSQRLHPDFLPPQPGQNQDARLSRLSVGTRVYLAIGGLIGLTLLVIFWAAAPSTAPTFGPLALVLFTASVWVPLGSAAVYLSSRFQKPVISAIFAVWVLASLSTDNHALRTAADVPPEKTPRPAANEVFARWLAALRPAGAAPAGSTPLPVFFATAEGGGLRAAYWTAKVLGGLADADDPRFADRLFAVSAVSGGSLGASVFDALVAERRAGKLPLDRTFSDQAKGVLGEDFLSPVLAAMLYPDALVHFIPGGAVFESADRARAMEASFERSWRAHVGTDRMARPFRALWQGPADARLPHLLLNTTCTETGRRFAVSDLVAAPRIGDVGDALDVVGDDVPLSTAAHMSARFPYVSPGGRVRAHPDVCGHFVDGGYFENSGAATLLDLIEALPDQDQEGNVSWIPVVIAINNDPDRNRQEQPLEFLSELEIPVETLLETRGARGRSAEISLLKYVTGDVQVTEPPSGCMVRGDDKHGYYVEFALPPPRNSVPVPLGWMLSGAAQGQMDEHWNEDSCRAARSKVHELLAR